MCYVNQTTAVLAAGNFEGLVNEIMGDFDSAGRKPAHRQSILTDHGVDSKFMKRCIRDQRKELVDRLMNGSSSLVENNIVKYLCTRVHDQTILEKSSIEVKGAGFTASFSGSQQKVEQAFKPFKAASDWIIQLHKADKDKWQHYSNTQYVSRYIYIYIVLTLDGLRIWKALN